MASGWVTTSFAMKREIRWQVYTSEYATYANERIPTDRVALTGILHYGKADGEDYYMIKMRDEGDCQILH